MAICLGYEAIQSSSKNTCNRSESKLAEATRKAVDDSIAVDYAVSESEGLTILRQTHPTSSSWRIDPPGTVSRFTETCGMAGYRIMLPFSWLRLTAIKYAPNTER